MFCPAEGYGSIKVKVSDGKRWTDETLGDVRYVPALGANLLSFGVITGKGMNVVMSGNGVKIVRQGKVILAGHEGEQHLSHAHEDFGGRQEHGSFSRPKGFGDLASTPRTPA